MFSSDKLIILQLPVESRTKGFRRFFLIFFAEKFAGIKNLFYLCTRKSETTATAKIAQLVEHDLAKVGVAGSSPVFRSLVRMAELVDALL